MRAKLVAAAPLMALLGFAGGCASHHRPEVAVGDGPKPPIVCPQGQSRATTAELVFGRDHGGQLIVTDAEWRRFIDEDVTPRFPDGLSVMDVQGHWRAPNGQMIREPSKVLYLVLDGGPDDPKKIANIQAAYQRRFQQEPVLLATRMSCVAD